MLSRIYNPAHCVCYTLLMYAWHGFLWSFFLPALDRTQGTGSATGTPISGWEAFKLLQAVFCPLVWVLKPTVLVLFPIIYVSTIFASLAPVWGVLREMRLVAVIIIFPGVVCAIALPRDLTGNLYCGYYLWVGSMLAECILLGVDWSVDYLRNEMD